MELNVAVLVSPYLAQLGLKSTILEVDPTARVALLPLDAKVLLDASLQPFDLVVLSRSLYNEVWQCEQWCELPIAQSLLLLVGNGAERGHAPIEGLAMISLDGDEEQVKATVERCVVEAKERRGDDDADEVTSRERDIIRDIALGLSSKEIADKNFISPHTVVTHRKNISKKLGIKSISGLTIYAIVNKLISIDDVKSMEE